MKRLGCLAAALVLSGCVSLQRPGDRLSARLEALMGGTYSDAVAELGPSSREMAAEDGTTILIWYASPWNDPGPYPCPRLSETSRYDNVSCTHPAKIEEMLWLGADGKLFRWSWRYR